jgi:hypothetical protein
MLRSLGESRGFGKDTWWSLTWWSVVILVKLLYILFFLGPWGNNRVHSSGRFWKNSDLYFSIPCARKKIVRNWEDVTIP